MCTTVLKTAFVILQVTIGTTEDEADTFTKLYRYTGFSLQLYRIYFILTMQALKGVNVAENSEESVHLDCSGCRYHPRFPYSRTYKVSESNFSDTITRPGKTTERKPLKRQRLRRRSTKKLSRRSRWSESDANSTL